MDRIRYTLTRKAVKNINLRVKQDGTVTVSAPWGTPLAVIDAFVESRMPWIAKAQKEAGNRPLLPWSPENALEGAPVSYLGKPLTLRIQYAKRAALSFGEEEIVLYTPHPSDSSVCARHLKAGWEKQCMEVFAPILSGQASRITRPLRPYTLKIRDMKSRWGTCHVKKGVISLSSRLLQYQESCIAYVALHELIHFFHPNHGTGFHKALADLWPGWQRERERLKNGPA